MFGPDQQVRLLQPIGEYAAGTVCRVARTAPGSDECDVVFDDGRKLTVTRIALAPDAEDAVADAPKPRP